MKIKIAAVQLNPCVGDLEGNYKLIMDAYKEASAHGADLVVMPEAALTGYPLEDLVLRKSFMEEVNATADDLCKEVLGLGLSSGLIFGTPRQHDDYVFNSARLIDPLCPSEVEKVTVIDKVELPNYGVFDEKRVYTRGGKPLAWNFRGRRLGVMICEDAWFPHVSRELWMDAAVMLIAINGSPFEVGKNVTRRQVAAKRIKETGLPFLYVNLVGGQDEIVFDGGSFFYDGKTVTEAPYFQSGITYIDTNLSDDNRTAQQRVTDWGEVVGWKNAPAPLINLDNYPTVTPMGVGEAYQAITTGTRDYASKSGFTSGILGYSGGVDSGLVAAVGCDALGPENMHLVRMPTKYTSEASMMDAYTGAKRLGANLRTINIEAAVEAVRVAYRDTEYDYKENTGEQLTGTADENTQSRTRGTILTAIGNQEHHLVLNTGNKSENSVGYFTKASGNDANGDWNPIKDCYKSSMVKKMCEWRNSLTEAQIKAYGFLGREGIVVPQEIIDKVPTAELAEGQVDTDSLPDYETELDPILHCLVEEEESTINTANKLNLPLEMVRKVRRMLIRAEHKRKQASPGPRITSKIHGRDRRYPNVNKWFN